MSTRSRSRSLTAGREREERRRKRRTGWDVGADDSSADPAAAAALAAAAASRINSGGMYSAQLPGVAGLQTLQAKTATSPHPSMCRIYVGSLDYYLTELEIKSVFQAFGTVVSVDMPKEGDRSKGFCFVEYASPEAAQMALSTMQNFVLKGRTIKVGRPTAVGAAGFDGTTGTTPATGLMSSAQAGAAAATAILAGRACPTPQPDLASLIALSQASHTPEKAPPESLPGSNRVYVGNVPFGFSSEDLKKIFVCFGAILNCQLLPSQDNPQQHRGYGFIEFASADAAKLAIETMNGFDVVGKQLKVNYATALRAGSGMDIPYNQLATLGGAASQGNPVGLGTALAGSGANLTPLGAPNPVLSQQTLQQQPLLQQQAHNHQNSTPAQQAKAPRCADGSPVSVPSTEQPTDQFPEHPTGVAGSTRVLLLLNMVPPEEVDDDLKEEVREECCHYGEVNGVHVRVGSDVKIYVEFVTTAGASAAALQLHGRWFGGRQIHVNYFPQDRFDEGALTLA